MTKEDQLLIDELKHNIRRLINSLEQTKAELVAVTEKKDSLLSELSQMKDKNEALEVRYKNLKVAKALAEGDTDNQAARQKINKIIREVDKCIALLNQ